MNKFFKFLIWVYILVSTLGFRLITKSKWDISKEDPTIWIKLCESDFNIGENDISSEQDPLYGISNLTINQIIQAVIDDYNAVPTSFLRLAKYPDDPNNPGSPLAGDSPFTIDKASKRTIEICFGATDARVTSGGYAKPNIVGKYYIGCEIRAKETFLAKASLAAHLIAHELGHCFSLSHPQEGTHSLMSYFTTIEAQKLRLQDDDKAGLTYVYPEDQSYADEKPTYGLTGCQPKD